MTVHASTNGEWVPAPNPLGGAPIAEYMTNSDGGTSFRPLGHANGEGFTEADALAFNIARDLFDGDSMDEIRARYAAFNAITTAQVAGVDGRVNVTTLPSATQQYFTDVNNRNAAMVADATKVIMTGSYQSPPVAPVNAPPPAAPVVTQRTELEVLKAQDQTPSSAPIGAGASGSVAVIRRADNPIATLASGSTNAASSATGQAPATAPAAATSVTGGSVTAQDLGVQPPGTKPTPAWVPYAIGAAVIGIVLAVVLKSGGGA